MALDLLLQKKVVNMGNFADLKVLSEKIVCDHIVTDLHFTNLPAFFGRSFASFMRRSLFLMTDCCFISSFYIEGVSSIYDLIDCIKEDIIDVMLNLRNVVLDCDDDSEYKIYSSIVRGPCTFSAKMIDCDGVKVCNPDLHIFTCVKNISFEFRLKIYNKKCGRNFNTRMISDSNNLNNPINWIDINNSEHVSPIHNVSYEVDNSFDDSAFVRYDEIKMCIKSSVAFGAVDALNLLFKMFVEYFGTFSRSIGGLVVKDIDEDVDLHVGTYEQDCNVKNFNDIFNIKTEDLELSVRSLNCLSSEGIFRVGHLVKKKESDILKTPNFGRKSLNEIREVLHKMGLSFGMNVDGWSEESCKIDDENNNDL